ncbi:hypothetical protein GTY49_03405, partial [Streptomyces sp. SID5477]|nr:hypothetical protein [Streptomyces sp. SID5477]
CRPRPRAVVAVVRQGRRRRLRRVGSLVHRPCIARRPPHSLRCPSPAPNGARRVPCRTIHQYRHSGT